MIKKIALTLVLSIVCLLPAAGSLYAATFTNPHDELVYRTNLGRSDDVKLLLDKGASPDEKNDAGVPLIALAASRTDRENMAVLKVLVEAGASLNAKDAAGQTALFYAVKQGNMPAVKYLLSKGIDYYATDNGGNTARNVAYTNGHKDIGVAIDDFINAQSAERSKQYQDFNQKVIENSKQPVPSPTPTPTPAPVSTQTPTPTPAPIPPALAQTEPNEEKPAELTPEEQEEQDKREEERKKLASDLAFNTCAFQYWSFVSDTKQSTELSSDALDDTIDSYQDKVTTIKGQLVKDYHMLPRRVNKISNMAEQRIFRDLNSMPSKNDRHEHGVGKLDDMKTRCRVAARRWDKELPPAPPPPPPSASKRK